MKNDKPDKLDLRSHDITEEKRQQLLRLFPEIRTEGGKLDFDRLRLALGEAVDVSKERYGMTWPGKADCFKTIQAPNLGTLRPCPEESVNFDSTENLIIEEVRRGRESFPAMLNQPNSLERVEPNIFRLPWPKPSYIVCWSVRSKDRWTQSRSRKDSRPLFTAYKAPDLRGRTA